MTGFRPSGFPPRSYPCAYSADRMGHYTPFLLGNHLAVSGSDDRRVASSDSIILFSRINLGLMGNDRIGIPEMGFRKFTPFAIALPKAVDIGAFPEKLTETVTAQILRPAPEQGSKCFGSPAFCAPGTNGHRLEVWCGHPHDPASRSGSLHLSHAPHSGTRMCAAACENFGTGYPLLSAKPGTDIALSVAPSAHFSQSRDSFRRWDGTGPAFAEGRPCPPAAG